MKSCQNTYLAQNINTYQKKNFKFNKCRDLREKWMTIEFLQEIVTKNKMYVEWKTTPIN